MTEPVVLHGSSHGVDWVLTIQRSGDEAVLALELPGSGRRSRASFACAPSPGHPGLLRSASRTGPARLIAWCHPDIDRVQVEWRVSTMRGNRPRVSPVDLHEVERDGLRGRAGTAVLDPAGDSRIRALLNRGKELRRVRVRGWTREGTPAFDGEV